jgi:hypothetical protein
LTPKSEAHQIAFIHEFVVTLIRNFDLNYTLKVCLFSSEEVICCMDFTPDNEFSTIARCIGGTSEEIHLFDRRGVCYQFCLKRGLFSKAMTDGFTEILKNMTEEEMTQEEVTQEEDIEEAKPESEDNELVTSLVEAVTSLDLRESVSDIQVAMEEVKLTEAVSETQQ